MKRENDRILVHEQNQAYEQSLVSDKLKEKQKKRRRRFKNFKYRKKKKDDK